MPPSNETITERLIRMEEKLDHYLSNSLSQGSRLDSHDVRIRALETGSAKIMGYVSVTALAVSAFGSFIVDRIAGH